VVVKVVKETVDEVGDETVAETVDEMEDKTVVDKVIQTTV
jgi:hypothetical protein